MLVVNFKVISILAICAMSAVRSSCVSAAKASRSHPTCLISLDRFYRLMLPPEWDSKASKSSWISATEMWFSGFRTQKPPYILIGLLQKRKRRLAYNVAALFTIVRISPRSNLGAPGFPLRLPTLSTVGSFLKTGLDPRAEAVQ
jgi:hypothetical protein